MRPGTEVPAGEPDDVTASVPQREHQPVAEAIQEPAPAPMQYQAGGDHLAVAVAAGAQVAGRRRLCGA